MTPYDTIETAFNEHSGIRARPETTRQEVRLFTFNASHGNVELVARALAVFGEGIANARDDDGENALFATIAGETGEAYEIVELLLRHGCKADDVALEHAWRTYQLKIFNLLRRQE